MLIYVLGAPGSGKTTVAPLLRQRLTDYVILDWDMFMSAASTLAGRDLRNAPDTWPTYGALVRATVDSIHPHPIVLLGVCTPSELAGWPIDAALLLDCSDDQRRRRLGADRAPNETADAITDARNYRALGLPVVDGTGRSPTDLATALADVILRSSA